MSRQLFANRFHLVDALAMRVPLVDWNRPFFRKTTKPPDLRNQFQNVASMIHNQIHRKFDSNMQFFKSWKQFVDKKNEDACKKKSHPANNCVDAWLCLYRLPNITVGWLLCRYRCVTVAIAVYVRGELCRTAESCKYTKTEICYILVARSSYSLYMWCVMCCLVCTAAHGHNTQSPSQWQTGGFALCSFCH